MLADACHCPLPTLPSCVACPELGVATGRLFPSSSKIAPRQRGEVSGSAPSGVYRAPPSVQIHRPEGLVNNAATQDSFWPFFCFVLQSRLRWAVFPCIEVACPGLAWDGRRRHAKKDAANLCETSFLCWVALCC